MSDKTTVYAGQIKSITGKIQVTKTYEANERKQAARMADLDALEAKVVHKTIDDKGESVVISGTLTTANLNTTNLTTTTLETTDQINAKTVVANDSISVSNTTLNADGFETDGSLTVAGVATIGGDVTIGGKLTANKEVKISAAEVTTEASSKSTLIAPTIQLVTEVGKDETKTQAVVKTTVNEATPQVEIQAPVIQLKGNADAALSLSNGIELNSSSEINFTSPEIQIKSEAESGSITLDSTNDIKVKGGNSITLTNGDEYTNSIALANNSITLNGDSIVLNGTATTPTAINLNETLETVQSSGKVVNPTTGEDYYIVNNATLHAYNTCVDAKINNTTSSLIGTPLKETNENKTVWNTLEAIQDNISNGLHFIGVYSADDEKAAEDILNESISNPKAGDLAIVGTQEYVYSGSKSSGTGKWNQLGDEQTHATVEYVNTELAGKVDNTTYDDEVKALKAEDEKIRGEFADADTALEDTLTKLITAKAAQSEFEALSATVTEHATTKLNKSEFDTHVSTYTTHIANQASVDSDQNDRIKAVEDSLKAGGDTYKAIAAAQAQADKGVEDAKSAQDDVDALAEKVGEVTSDKSLVDQLTAVSGRVTTLEDKLPSQYKLDTGLFGELETDTEGNLTGALIIRTVQKQAAAVNGINNNEVY